MQTITVCNFKESYVSKILFEWFADNQMKVIPDKLKMSIMIENRQIHNSTCEKLLGVFFDSKLTFQSHMDNICKKATHKSNAISRITLYMDFNKRKLVVNAFFHHNLTTVR